MKSVVALIFATALIGYLLVQAFMAQGLFNHLFYVVCAAILGWFVAALLYGIRKA